MIRTTIAQAALAAATVLACGGTEAPPLPPEEARIREVRLVDSIPWETELAAGVHRRILVTYDGLADTIPGVTTSRRPVVLGDTTVFGFDEEAGEVVAAFRYRLGSTEVETIRLPEDFLSFAAFALAPDAEQLAYIGEREEGRLAAVVRTWPAKAPVYESHAVEGYPSDGPNSSVEWAGEDEVEIRIRLDDLDTPGGSWLVVRGAPAAGTMVVDTVAGGEEEFDGEAPADTTSPEAGAGESR